MPYTPTQPTLVLCQALVDALTADWTPSSPNGVAWDFLNPFGDAADGATKIDGRQVVFFPTGADSAYATRGADRWTHQISALTVERYTDGGRPPRDWTAERVDFVNTYLVDGLDFNRDGPPSWNKQLGTLSQSILLYDPQKLETAGYLFWSLVVVEFEEFI